MRRITNFPTDLAIGGDGRLYVLNRGSAEARIRVLSDDDEDLGHIGALGSGDGQLTGPVAILMARDESLFVSDELLHRITVLSKDGEFLGRWGEHGSGDGQLDRPSGIAFDQEENLYVADTLNHRVQKFTRDGTFLMGWGSYGDGAGQFNMPWGIKVDELGDVYVADWRNDRVQKFGPGGELIFAFGGPGSGPGEFNRPAGLDVDADGDIYVADSGNNRVQLFSPEGRYVERFSGDATLSKQGLAYLVNNAKPLRLREMADLEPQKRFREPKGVRVDPNGRMYVADSGSYRVQVYQKEALRLGPDQIAPPLRNATLATT